MCSFVFPLWLSSNQSPSNLQTFGISSNVHRFVKKKQQIHRHWEIYRAPHRPKFFQFFLLVFYKFGIKIEDHADWRHHVGILDLPLIRK